MAPALPLLLTALSGRPLCKKRNGSIERMWSGSRMFRHLVRPSVRPFGRSRIPRRRRQRNNIGCYCTTTCTLELRKRHAIAYLTTNALAVGSTTVAVLLPMLLAGKILALKLLLRTHYTLNVLFQLEIKDKVRYLRASRHAVCETPQIKFAR